jgi:hypothetical protein
MGDIPNLFFEKEKAFMKRLVFVVLAIFLPVVSVHA